MLQIIRWLMRVEAPSDQYQFSTFQSGDETSLVLSAMYPDGSPQNGLSPMSVVLNPSGESSLVHFRQEGPGRYIGKVKSDFPGAYLATAQLDNGVGLLHGNFTVSYSREFKLDRGASQRLLNLTTLKPLGGEPGQAGIESPSTDPNSNRPRIDFFRPQLMDRPTETPVWHYLAFAFSILLLLDIANRRIAWLGRRGISPKASPRVSQMSPVSNAAERFKKLEINVGTDIGKYREDKRMTPSDADGGPSDGQTDFQTKEETRLTEYTQRLKMAKNRTRNRKGSKGEGGHF